MVCPAMRCPNEKSLCGIWGPFHGGGIPAIDEFGTQRFQTIKLWDALPQMGHQIVLEIFRQPVGQTGCLGLIPAIPNAPITSDEGFPAAGYRQYFLAISPLMWMRLQPPATTELPLECMETVDLQAPGEGGANQEGCMEEQDHNGCAGAV